MTLPTILPTGTMASGSYVDYMMGYCDEAMDSLETQVEGYPAYITMSNWNTAWDTVLDETESKMTVLESSITTLQQQIIIAQRAVSGVMYD